MPYCTSSDLEKYYLGKTFDASDYLSSTKANVLIAADYALINMSIRSRYSLPITDSDDLAVLQMLNEMMTVGTIDDIFRERTADGTFERGRNTRKEALKMLEEIKDGTMILASAGVGSVIKFNNLDSDGNEVLPRFKDSKIDSE